MSYDDDRRERLERLMQRALGEIPARRAPATLEERVLREIERRTVRPWWRKGFAQWPPGARAALIACCCGSLIAVLAGFSRLVNHLATSRLDAPIARHLEGLRGNGEAVASLGALLSRLIRMIPSEWLLGGLLAIGLLYAMLFALIAVAYSTLYVAPQPSGTRSP